MQRSHFVRAQSICIEHQAHLPYLQHRVTPPAIPIWRVLQDGRNHREQSVHAVKVGQSGLLAQDGPKQLQRHLQREGKGGEGKKGTNEQRQDQAPRYTDAAGSAVVAVDLGCCSCCCCFVVCCCEIPHDMSVSVPVFKRNSRLVGGCRQQNEKKTLKKNINRHTHTLFSFGKQEKWTTCCCYSLVRRGEERK